MSSAECCFFGIVVTLTVSCAEMELKSCIGLAILSEIESSFLTGGDDLLRNSFAADFGFLRIA